MSCLKLGRVTLAVLGVTAGHKDVRKASCAAIELIQGEDDCGSGPSGSRGGGGM